MKSEKELLQLLHAGDEESIRIIFDEFYDGLCLYAASFTLNFQVAEELVEDVFLHIWLQSSSLIITKSFKSYLYKSVYNGCLKWLKSDSRRRLNSETDSLSIIHSSQYPDPESQLILHELERKAEFTLETLPEQCRKIYELSRFENLTYSQIAHKLNITVGTVKTQMSRAFKKFKEDFRL